MAVGADMWAVVPDATGLHEVRMPRPVRRSGEVLVRLLAAGVGADDLATPECGWMSARVGEQGRAAPTLVGMVEQADPEQGALAGRVAVVMPALACGERAPCTGEWPSLCSEPSNAWSEVPPFLAEWVSVPAAAVITLPTGCPLVEATLLGVAAGTLSAVRKARIEIGQSVAMVGTAVESILAGQWVRIAGAYDVYIVDNDPRGLALARKLWLGERIDADTQSAAAIRAQRDGRGVDLAVVLAGDTIRLRLAMNLVGPGGRVLALHTAAAAARKDHAAAPEHEVVRLIDASTAAVCASRFDWEIAARTWGSGRLALRDVIAERVSVQELVARVNAGLTDGKGFLVVSAPERA